MLVLVGPPPARDDGAEARAVIDRAISALGGVERLTGQPARTWKGKGTLHNKGEAVPFLIHGARQGPGQIVLALEGTGKLTYRKVLVLDGNHGWVKLGDRLEELKGEALAEEQQRNYVNWLATLVPLSGEEFVLSLLPSVDVEGRPAVGVLVQRARRREVRLYFDRETGLLVKREAVIRDVQAGGHEVTEEVIFRDYRSLDGVKQATRFKVYWDGKLRSEVEVPEQERRAKLDPAVFARP
jgi:hypothetical protein